MSFAKYLITQIINIQDQLEETDYFDKEYKRLRKEQDKLRDLFVKTCEKEGLTDLLNQYLDSDI